MCGWWTLRSSCDKRCGRLCDRTIETAEAERSPPCHGGAPAKDRHTDAFAGGVFGAVGSDGDRATHRIHPGVHQRESIRRALCSWPSVGSFGARKPRGQMSAPGRDRSSTQVIRRPTTGLSRPACSQPVGALSGRSELFAQDRRNVPAPCQPPDHVQMASAIRATPAPRWWPSPRSQPRACQPHGGST